MADNDIYLFDFYGTECPHCHDMDPLVERLEKEENVTVKKVEIWHNAENAKFFEECDKGRCGGVPFFYNKKNDTYICGAATYDKLKAWALGA
jgi:thiol-disulfide isomerase/thioredoxin